jgi:SAM-dependent methyltransferase
LARFAVEDGDLLEFGSGTGKHGRLLAGRGYSVAGIERSEEMAAQAQASPGFICRQGDIRSVSLGRTFDAVLALFHVVSYQVSNSDVSAVLENAARHLEPGGIFFFDVWYTPAVLVQRPEVRVKRMSDDHSDVTRLAEPVIWPGENRVDVNYTIFIHEKASGAYETFSETHSMRHFSLPELDLFAKHSGFRREGAEEFFSGINPGEDTWGVCIVLRKV